MQNDRFEALVHLAIFSAPRSIDRTRLRAALWLIDREWHIANRRTMSGRDYLRLGEGPTPHGFAACLADLVKSGKISEAPTPFDHANRKYTSEAQPDLQQFSAEERELVAAVIGFVQETSRRDLADTLHDELWRDHEIGEPIRVELSATAAFLKPVDEAALAWLRRVERVTR